MTAATVYVKFSTMKRSTQGTPKRSTGDDQGFADRLAQIVAEYGSRYAVAKATSIPATTLQNYALGSRPGIDALTTLARVANVDLTWLLTGRGEIRGEGQLPGALLNDVVVVDQYDPKSSLQIPVLVSEIPFSRHYLENGLHLTEPGRETLLAIESAWELFNISRHDLLLIDRNQAQVAVDGVYLLNLPGFSLRGVLRRPGGKLRLIEPRLGKRLRGDHGDHSEREGLADSYEIDRLELLGDGHQTGSKVVGRAVWIGRPL